MTDTQAKILTNIKFRLIAAKRDSELSHAYMAGLYLSGCAYRIQKEVFAASSRVDQEIERLVNYIEDIDNGNIPMENQDD